MTRTPLLPLDQHVDDKAIPDSLVVWRTLDPLEAPFDPTTGQREIMSSVFRSEEVSVYLSDHISFTDVVMRNPGAYIAEFTHEPGATGKSEQMLFEPVIATRRRLLAPGVAVR